MLCKDNPNVTTSRHRITDVGHIHRWVHTRAAAAKLLVACMVEARPNGLKQHHYNNIITLLAISTGGQQQCTHVVQIDLSCLRCFRLTRRPCASGHLIMEPLSNQKLQQHLVQLDIALQQLLFFPLKLNKQLQLIKAQQEVIFGLNK